MAFQFVPNADGSFDEGMRQTNPETGVEYIYTDGAWRPLGPKVEDQYDLLDARYLKREGNEDFSGNLYIQPWNTETSRFRLMKANTPHAFEFTSHPATTGILSNSKVHIRISNEKDADGNDDPQTILRHLPEPTVDHQAVSKSYVDNEFDLLPLTYLPSAGGRMYGDLVMYNSKDIEFQKNGGNSQFKISTNVSDYYTNIYSFANPIDGFGGMRFRISSDQDTTGTYGTCLSIGAKSHDVGSTTHPWETQVNFLRTPEKDHHAANKKYVDDHKAIVRTGTSTSPSLSTGELYFNTSTKQLFIGD